MNCRMFRQGPAKIIAYNLQKLHGNKESSHSSNNTQRPDRRPKTQRTHPQTVRRRNPHRILPKYHSHRMQPNQRNENRRRHKSRLAKTRTLPLPRPQHCTCSQNLPHDKRRRTLWRHSLQLPTTNLLWKTPRFTKNGNITAQPAAKHNQQSSNPPKIPNHWPRRKTNP